MLEDRYLRLFDLRFGVKTSGYIALDQTSLSSSEIRDLHRYRGVNAWALRKMFRTIRPEKSQTFVDLGSGLGRACLLAAEYGFSRVTGVELVPEFCSTARRNVETYLKRHHVPGVIRILNVDARAYTSETDDDVYFLYRPFSGDVLTAVCTNIKNRSRKAGKVATLLYSERIVQTASNNRIFTEEYGMQEIWTGAWWGQRFWGFRFLPLLPLLPSLCLAY